MITIDWSDRIISIPRDDLALIQSTPTEIRELPLNWFRMQLKDLEDSEAGIVNPKTHNHNTEVSLGGLTYARIIEIVNGYTITFEDGQYAVNLTGANSNVGDVVNVNQVSVRSQNSAGMTSSPAIEHSSFEGAVWIDTTSDVVGTLYPTGSALRPVNNFADAKLIADYRGFGRIRVVGNAIIEDIDLSNFIIEGTNAILSSFDLKPSAILNRCTITNARVTGTLDGDTFLERCYVSGINYFNGMVYQCAFDENPVLIRGSNMALFMECYSASPTDNLTVFDCAGSSAPLTIRNFSGCFTVVNRNIFADSCINFTGECVLDSSCTIGDFDISGTGDLVDNTTGDAFVLSRKLVHSDEIAKSVWSYER